MTELLDNDQIPNLPMLKDSKPLIRRLVGVLFWVNGVLIRGFSNLMDSILLDIVIIAIYGIGSFILGLVVVIILMILSEVLLGVISSLLTRKYKEWIDEIQSQFITAIDQYFWEIQLGAQLILFVSLVTIRFII